MRPAPRRSRLPALRIVAGLVAAVSPLVACGSSTSPPGSTAPATAATAGTTSTAATPPASWAIEAGASRLLVQVMAADGSGRTSPAEAAAGGDQTNPDWSPDGRRLVFVMTDAGGHDDLWVTNADGSGSQMLADCEAPCDDFDDPAWSPDGRTIATCKLATAAEGVHLGTLVSVDVATGAATTLFTPAKRRDFCAGPRFAPDGGSVVLELVHRDGTGALAQVRGVTLAIVDLTSQPPAVRGLTDPALFAATADWSRDGRLIVYAALPAAGGEATDLFTIAPDGSGRRRLTTLAASGGSAEHPAFDLDGRSVVFVAEGAAPLSRVDLATGAVDAAFAPDTAGAHPRARPAAG